MTGKLLKAGIRATFGLAGLPPEDLDTLPVVDLRYLAERCREWLMETRVAGILERALVANRERPFGNTVSADGGETCRALTQLDAQGLARSRTQLDTPEGLSRSLPAARPVCPLCRRLVETGTEWKLNDEFHARCIEIAERIEPAARPVQESHEVVATSLPGGPYDRSTGDDLGQNGPPECIGHNRTCPCQDGDLCHYQGPDPWPIPRTITLPSPRCSGELPSGEAQLGTGAAIPGSREGDGRPLERAIKPSPLAAQDALDFIEAYHRGETHFTYTWERLTALGVSSAVMQAFLTEAFGEARR
jgi:hypothetical protein